MIRSEKKLRWQVGGAKLNSQLKSTQPDFKIESIKEKPKTLFSRVKGMFKSQRGN